jgi:hypothetical protein
LSASPSGCGSRTGRKDDGKGEQGEEEGHLHIAGHIETPGFALVNDYRVDGAK